VVGALGSLLLRLLGEPRQPFGKFIAAGQSQPAMLHVKIILDLRWAQGSFRLPLAFLRTAKALTTGDNDCWRWRAFIVPSPGSFPQCPRGVRRPPLPSQAERDPVPPGRLVDPQLVMPETVHPHRAEVEQFRFVCYRTKPFSTGRIAYCGAIRIRRATASNPLRLPA
jgi:hypothetical protein